MSARRASEGGVSETPRSFATSRRVKTSVTGSRASGGGGDGRRGARDADGLGRLRPPPRPKATWMTSAALASSSLCGRRSRRPSFVVLGMWGRSVNERCAGRRASLYQRRLDVDVNPHPAGVGSDTNLARIRPSRPGAREPASRWRREARGRARGRLARRPREERGVRSASARQDQARRAVPDAPVGLLANAALAHHIGAIEHVAPSRVGRAHEHHLPRPGPPVRTRAFASPGRVTNGIVANTSRA